MKLSIFCTATLAAFALLAVASPARAALVVWSVDSTVSYVRLNIPDQSSNLDGSNVTLRVRNADNSAWSDAGGRRAPLGGTIATNLNYGSSISFLSGQHDLFALETGSHRPNPAAFDPSATNVGNPDGQYTDTSGAPAAFAGKLRPLLLALISADLGFFSFRDVSFDILSGVLPLDVNGAFAGGSSQFGIDSAVLDLDGVTAQIVGQAIPDLLNQPLGSSTGLNTLGGSIVPLYGMLPVLTLNINTPLFVDLNGVPLQMSLTGQIVAYAVIPEPSSVLLASCAALALIWAGRRRLKEKASSMAIARPNHLCGK